MATPAETRVSRQADEIKNLTIRKIQLNDELTGALGAAKKAEHALLSQRAKLNAAADLTDKIAFRSANAVARSTISLPAEAVPVLGIVTVVAVTAWDVIDLCATMDDMAKIKSSLKPADSPGVVGNEESRRYCGRTAQDLKSLLLGSSKQPAEKSCAELRKRFPTEDLAACEDLPPPTLPELEAKKEALPLPTIPDYD